MLRSRGAHGTPAELVANQVLQGLGGGLACVALQVSAQADVVHAGKSLGGCCGSCAQGLYRCRHGHCDGIADHRGRELCRFSQYVVFLTSSALRS